MTDPTPPPDRPPLWLLMQDAVIKAPPPKHHPAGEIAAAQIRALADWLLPEESEPEPGCRYEQRHIIWQRDNRLRTLLLAEAQRAEEGR